MTSAWVASTCAQQDVVRQSKFTCLSSPMGLDDTESLETRAVWQSLRKRFTMTEKENVKIKTMNRAVN